MRSPARRNRIIIVLLGLQEMIRVGGSRILRVNTIGPQVCLDNTQWQYTLKYSEGSDLKCAKMLPSRWEWKKWQFLLTWMVVPHMPRGS